MASGKGRTHSGDILESALDGTTFTGQTAAGLRFILGTGTPTTTTGLLSAYNTDLGLAAMTGTVSWATTDAAAGLGSTASINGSVQWTNGTASTIVVTEMAIMRSTATPNTAASLLYSVGALNVSVGAGGTITINPAGLTVTER